MMGTRCLLLFAVYLLFIRFNSALIQARRMGNDSIIAVEKQ